jgi:succinoglycan biosynthesis protein ExoV
MKIMSFKGKYPNFGDELNLWMWPKIIPDFFDDDEKALFVGIGSVIGEKYSEVAKKIVFGAGYVRQYHGDNPPDVHGTDWDIYFVRGPRTAQILNLSPDMAVGDSAILLRKIVDFKNKSPDVISFMPHWESLDTGSWQQACQLAGLNFIDPRWPVDEVLNKILGSRFIITEAMHGAIVADALRVPWIPLLPINGKHREKWFDWAEALKMDLRHYRLWPSSIEEAGIALERHPKLGNFARSIGSLPLSGFVNKAATHLAAHKLSTLAKTSPCLSEDSEINRVTEIMLGKVEKLRRDYAGCLS